MRMDYDIIALINNNIMLFKDPYNHHGPRVGKLSKLLATEMSDLSKEDIKMIEYGAMLHDIGKLYLPEGLTVQPRKLTLVEKSIVETHVTLGTQLLNHIGCDTRVINSAWTHHENWDGTGYPRGLIEYEIPLCGRIVRIIDVYDALTHDRSYRKAFGKKFTLTYISEQKGKMFDPDMVDLFINMMKGSKGSANRED